MDKRERDAKKDLFVEAYATTGVIGPAAKVAGVHRRTILDWKEADPDFKQRCGDAYEDAIDVAELEIRNRGVHGRQKPVMYKGRPMFVYDPRTGDLVLDDDFEPVVLMETVDSNKLLEFYTSGTRNKFNAKQRVELSGPDGGNIPVERFIRFVGSDGDGRPDPIDEPGPEES